MTCLCSKIKARQGHSESVKLCNWNIKTNDSPYKYTAAVKRYMKFLISMNIAVCYRILLTKRNESQF